MSIHEYATSILSIVLGLGVAHVLGGIAWMARNPKHSTLYYVFGIWCASVLLATLGLWWAIWGIFRDLEALTYWAFLGPFLSSTFLYLACRILVPPSTELSIGLDENFPSVAKPFCLCLAVPFITGIIAGSITSPDLVLSAEGILGTALIGIALSGTVAKTPRHHIYVAIGWLCVYLIQQAIQPDIV